MLPPPEQHNPVRISCQGDQKLVVATAAVRLMRVSSRILEHILSLRTLEAAQF